MLDPATDPLIHERGAKGRRYCGTTRHTLYRGTYAR
jgi:hypothetical protein